MGFRNKIWFFRAIACLIASIKTVFWMCIIFLLRQEEMVFDLDFFLKVK